MNSHSPEVEAEQTLNKKGVVEYLERLNEYKHLKLEESRKKERLVFVHSEEVFKIFGGSDDKPLAPFNDYTYGWLNSFLSNVIDLLNYSSFESVEELKEAIEENLNEWVDSEVDVYTSDLTEWLAHNNSNIAYLNDVQNELGDSDNVLMSAQYLAIQELFNEFLPLLIEDLKAKFSEVEE